MRTITTERIPIKLWLDDIEPAALTQARNAANLKVAVDWVAIMPDSHVGYGVPIGAVLATDDAIVPNAVGVDIGCGMMAVRTNVRADEVPREKLNEIVGEARRRIPLGFSHHKEPQPWKGFAHAPDVPVIRRELASAQKQLGTLGGGNHFIELQAGDDGRLWAMVHSGSRNFGLQVATEYHKRAIEHCREAGVELPDKDLAFLPLRTAAGEEYVEAMNYCLQFAFANRAAMMAQIEDILARELGAAVDERINIHHNFAAIEEHGGRQVVVHRKGATKADAGLVGLIPGSMGTHSYVVEGLGNPESFRSCSHGAGRRMGRKEAIRKLSLEEEKRRMEGIIGAPRTQRELEEAPGAYKPIDDVMANQADLVRIRLRLRPLAVIKG